MFNCSSCFSFVVRPRPTPFSLLSSLCVNDDGCECRKFSPFVDSRLHFIRKLFHSLDSGLFQWLSSPHIEQHTARHSECLRAHSKLPQQININFASSKCVVCARVIHSMSTLDCRALISHPSRRSLTWARVGRQILLFFSTISRARRMTLKGIEPSQNKKRQKIFSCNHHLMCVEL